MLHVHQTGNSELYFIVKVWQVFGCPTLDLQLYKVISTLGNPIVMHAYSGHIPLSSQ